MGQQSQLEILISIRDELAGLTRARQGIAGAKQEAEGLGKLLREGLGIGTGMQLASEGISMLKETMSELVRGSFEMATEIKRGSDALGVTGEAYQVVQIEMAKAGVEMAHFQMAVTKQTDSLALARNVASSAAEAYKNLGLSVSQLESMTPEQRAIAVATAVFNATDKTKAFQAAGQILGSRGLPALLNGLRGLATDGYDKLADSAKKAGLIMSDDTAEKLHEAEQNIAKLKRAATIATGDAIAAAAAVKSSASSNFLGTMWAFMKSSVTGNVGDFATAVALNQPAKNEAPALSGLGKGPTFATSEHLFDARIAAQEKATAAISGDSMLSETSKRDLMNTALRTQIDLYKQLGNARYGGDWQKQMQDLGGRLTDKDHPLTEEEVSRYQQMLELQGKITDTVEKRKTAVDTPMLQLYREMADTTQLISTTLSGAVTNGISTLSSGIWGALSGTARWGDMFRNLGNIAGQVLTELIVKLLIVKPLLEMFGLDQQSLGGVGTPKVVSGGGGSFMTSGPTNFTVGDNPGGVELVSVLPISGVGRTTINGAAMKMAGGGSALVSGGAAGRGAAPIVVNLTQNNALGLSAAIRAELVAAAPSLRKMAVDAVQEAQMRNQLRFA